MKITLFNLNRKWAIVCALLTAFACLSQVKPDKTFDHEKFGKKVYGNFSAGMDPTIFLPDEKALEYIQSKTGKSIEDLKKEKERNRSYISSDKVTLQSANLGGKMVMGIELVKVDHSQLTMGNIIINAQGTKIVLGNCIQTDMTWVLGDYMCVEGKIPQRAVEVSPEEKIQSILSCQEKDYSELTKINWSFYSVIKTDAQNPKGVMKSGAQIERNNFYHCDIRFLDNGNCIGAYTKGKDILFDWVSFTLLADKNQLELKTKDNKSGTFTIYCSTKKQLILQKEEEGANYFFIGHQVEEKKETQNENNSSGSGKKLYTNSTKAGNANQSNFINESMFDKPMKGYYIDLNGKKTNAVIKYQSPEKMNSNSSALLLYKIAYNEPGFTADETNNYIGVKLKQEVSAFCVNGFIYVPLEGDKWGILVSEGQIRESVFLFKSQTGSGKTGYGESVWLHKRNGKSVGITGLALMFKNTMSEFVSDYTELADKIRNKESGYNLLNYQNIVSEYNQWYENQNPGKTPYLYSE